MPKTVRNVYENAVSFKNLLLAHKKARCGKREKEGNINRTNIRARVVKTRKGIKKLYIQTQ